MRKWFQIILLVWAGFALMVFVNKERFHYGWKDATWRTVMTPFAGTLWAEGFSEDRFSRVQVGMTANQVLEIIGEPLRKGCGETGCTWVYSWQDTPTADYDRRWVSFDTHSYVDEIRHDFYID